MATTTVFITNTATGTWVVPNDWAGIGATIEGISGGGAGGWSGKHSGGGTITGYGGGGGGGGGWGKLTNAESFFTAGQTVAIQVGTGGTAAAIAHQNGGAGGNTWVKDGGGTYRLNISGGAGGIGGQAGTVSGGSPGPGGSMSVGSAGHSGGAGGAGGPNIINSVNAGGGGAAAGPIGNGNSGGRGGSFSGGDGGAGGGGGTTGVGQIGQHTIGGHGGTGYVAAAGGLGGTYASPNGHAGSNGSGGGGGYSYQPPHSGIGGAGGAGVDMGSGKGAGGGSGGTSYSVNASIAPPGKYGGGAGGRSAYNFPGGSPTDTGTAVGGAQGILKIVYTPIGAPGSLSCGADTITSITPQWQPTGGTPTSYTLQWRVAGTGSWTTITGILTTSHQITGLSPGTQYEWQVEAIYGSTPSGFSVTAICTTAFVAPNVFQPQSLGIWRGQVGINWQGLALVGDAFTGLIGRSDFDNFTEYGNVMRLLVTSPPIQQDRRRIFLSRFEVDMQVGDGVQGNPDQAPQMMLDYSRNGGVTYSPVQKWRSMGAVGRYATRLRWMNMGYSRSWVLRLTCTDAVRRQIIGAYADWYAGEG